MKEVTGNIWDFYDQGHWIVITTNSVVSGGKNVMGKGIALEAKKRFPDLPRIIARHLLSSGNVAYPIYQYRLISFPTKYHWRAGSDINLIAESAEMLRDGVNRMQLEAVYLPRPGCGCGGLSWEDVKPVLEKYLDDRFVVVQI